MHIQLSAFLKTGREILKSLYPFTHSLFQVLHEAIYNIHILCAALTTREVHQAVKLFLHRMSSLALTWLCMLRSAFSPKNVTSSLTNKYSPAGRNSTAVSSLGPPSSSSSPYTNKKGYPFQLVMTTLTAGISISSTSLYTSPPPSSSNLINNSGFQA